MDLNKAFQSGGLTINTPSTGLTYQSGQQITSPIYFGGSSQPSYLGGQSNQGVLGAETSSIAPSSNSGGGSGDSQLSQLAKTNRNPSQEAEYQRLLSASQQQGPSQDQINGQINDIYNASNGYLNQAEQAVRNDYPTVQQDIQGQYDTSKGQLDTSHTSNLNQFNTQTDQAGYQNESALAASRRLYGELRQGYQQRFGGSTSAGQAASELANVEQQRQQGQTNRGYQDTLTTINNHKADVENQYQTGIQTLLTQKNQSLNQANRDFQNKLLTISQSRAQNEQAKGQARLQALQDLRNQIFSINQQNTQFQQTLEAQRQQAQLQLQSYQSLAGQGVSAGAGTLGSFTQQASQAPTSSLQAGGYAPSQQQQSYVGAISNNSIKHDQYGNPIVG